MKVNPVGNRFSEVNKAYLAGFIDADGAIMAIIEPHREKRFRFRVKIILKITQKDRKLLDWFHLYFKVGRIVRNRTAHDWIIRDQKDIKYTLKVIYPYLKSKNIQAHKALIILNTRISKLADLVKVANLADSLSRFNVRSKNRRKNYASMIQESLSSND